MNFLLTVFIIAFLGYCYLNPRNQKLENIPTKASITIKEHHTPQSVKLSRMVYPPPDVLVPSRKDVLLMTPWVAPIIWNGTFNIDILNEQFRLHNITIGLIVFVVKKKKKKIFHLKLFLEMAEMYFMVGHRVNYYIFTARQTMFLSFAFRKDGRWSSSRSRGMPAGRFPYTA